MSIIMTLGLSGQSAVGSVGEACTLLKIRAIGTSERHRAERYMLLPIQSDYTALAVQREKVGALKKSEGSLELKKKKSSGSPTRRAGN